MSDGKIKNRKQAQQLRDFSGLRFGSITPTDIDAMIEYKDKAYVIVEGKYKSGTLQGGQKLAFERLCDDLGTQKPSLLIVAKHNVEAGSDKDVDYANCDVAGYRYKRTWHWGEFHGTVRRLIDIFFRRIDTGAGLA